MIQKTILPTLNLSTTNYKVIDENEYTFDLAKTSPISAWKIETDITSPTSAVHIVTKKAPVFPSVKVPAILSSHHVPRKPSPVSTDYIILRVDIDGRYFSKAMINKNSYLILAGHCILEDEYCHSYFRVKGK